MFDLKIKYKNGKPTECSSFASMDELNAYDLSVYGNPEDYEKEIVDNSAIEAAKEQKKTDRQARIAQLKALDWSKITTVAQIKAILQVMAKELLKDEE